ncbi:MAG: sugar transporter [Flavobacteriaceae bacterium]|nr:MAG: sugar transporter [Flavobacteriaceae bacterium]
MKNKIVKTLALLCGIVLLSSCASSKEMIYFQGTNTSATTESLLSYEPKIQAGDILNIHVSAIDAEAAIPFNLYEGTGATNVKPITYLVNFEGTINFPVLGKLKVTGFTTKEVTETMTKILFDYIKNPIVNIRFTNFKVTVLGEVKSPGSYAVTSERITVIEALGLAGDLTIQGQRKSVLLVREQNGKRNFITIDLTSKALFNSPYYYMAQNDVLYVEPNKTKLNSSVVGSNTGVILSSVSILITLITLLTR